MSDQNAENKRQVEKEQVARLAIQRSMTLVRRGRTVVGLRADGSEQIISESKTEDTVWADALKALRKPQSDDKNTTERHNELIIHTDGGSRGNPGPSASGYVILTTDGSILEEGGEYLGITTNNQAEYQAVQHALEAAQKFQPKKIKLFIDSQLVVNQMKGVYKVKNRALLPVHEAIKQLASQFEGVTFEHVRREKNTLADSMVNQVLDAHTS